MSDARRLLAIIELGGYPDFSSLYRQLGFDAEVCVSMRKALALIRRQPPDVIVCEFNFQSDFRDRTSSLDSMIALVQQYPDIKVIVFMDPAHKEQFKKLEDRYPFHATMSFPIRTELLEQALKN